jgi:hypothetical protein
MGNHICILNGRLVGEEQTSDSIGHGVTVCHVDACDLEDRVMPSYSVPSVNVLFATQPGMMRIQERQAWRMVQLCIGHQLVDVTLRNALFLIINPRGNSLPFRVNWSAPLKVVLPEVWL